MFRAGNDLASPNDYCTSMNFKTVPGLKQAAEQQNCLSHYFAFTEATACPSSFLMARIWFFCQSWSVIAWFVKRNAYPEFSKKTIGQGEW